MAEKIALGRLAMRVEGNRWNAYYAPANTMDGSVLLGSILMMAVASNPERKKAFMDLMVGIVSEIIEGIVGLTPTWTAQNAPEHERSGNA